MPEFIIRDKSGELIGFQPSTSIVGATAQFATRHGVNAYSLTADHLPSGYTVPRTGDEVTNDYGSRGVVSDAYVKRAGHHKGSIEVVWIGSRYGVTYADPLKLTVITRLERE